MNTADRARFEEANKAIHPVEKQWHFPIMTKYGYEAVTKEGIGFVRSYTYRHPTMDRSMTVTTGASADYWDDPNPNGGHGYWSDLEPHLIKLNRAGAIERLADCL